MDRNSIIGLLLMGAVLITFSIWNAPSQEDIAQQQRVRDSIAIVEKNKSSKSVQAVKDTVADLSVAGSVTSNDSIVSTDSLKSL